MNRKVDILSETLYTERAIKKNGEQSMEKKRACGRDAAMMCLGNVWIGIGIALFSASRMGNDPNSAFVISLTGYIAITFSIMQIIINSIYFCVQFLWGRRYIGIGTIINWFFVGIIAEHTLNVISLFDGSIDSFGARLLLMLFGVLILSLGASLYQTADLGISPYDSLSIILSKRLSFPYFWCRIFTDAVCFVIAFLCRGPLGLGTIICAFGLGPFIQFFDEHVSRRLCKK